MGLLNIFGGVITSLKTPRPPVCVYFNDKRALCAFFSLSFSSYHCLILGPFFFFLFSFGNILHIYFLSTFILLQITPLLFIPVFFFFDYASFPTAPLSMNMWYVIV